MLFSISISQFQASAGPRTNERLHTEVIPRVTEDRSATKDHKRYMSCSIYVPQKATAQTSAKLPHAKNVSKIYLAVHLGNVKRPLAKKTARLLLGTAK
jgi:hypothetical protein